MLARLVLRSSLALVLASCACADPPSTPDGGPAHDAGPPHDATADAGSERDAAVETDASTAVDSGTELPPYPDLAIGPYPSALALLVDAIRYNARYDTGSTYSHSAAQGYVLQATALLLEDSLGHALPGGEPTRDELARIALDEIDELRADDDRVTSGGPAFGLDEAWDAFGDGSTNPAFTAYTWQSGMVALGAAHLARYFARAGERHADLAPRITELRAFAESLVEYWHAFYTRPSAGLGFYWYSDRSADAKAVHNTSALVAMASQALAESGSSPAFGERPPETAALLHARLRRTGDGFTYWNYCDDGLATRRAEDISHALVTLQFMRFAHDHGWWSDADMGAIARTLVGKVWTGNPLRMHGAVDGSSGGDREWAWTRAAAIGWAAIGDAPGGDPAVFDHARSLVFSTQLSAGGVPLEGGLVDSVSGLALARLLAHVPEPFTHSWTRVAGDGDTEPAAEGGARFYTVDWEAPRDVTLHGIAIPARVGTTANANFVVDLPDALATRDVVISIVWEAGSSGAIEQWDGTDYVQVTTLPASLDQAGEVRWARTTFRMRRDRFDYQGAVPGANVLFQITNRVALHAIEVTPL
jgi:hypothetical protein